jgi:Family of unknown function (DUF6011)
MNDLLVSSRSEVKIEVPQPRLDELAGIVRAGLAAIAAALRKAFPESGRRISVTSDRYNITVRWTDDGPTLEQVQEALLAAHCAIAKKAWNGECYLEPWGVKYSGSIYFDRYNAAQRAAEIEERDRRMREREAELKRISDVTERERKAWYATMPKPVTPQSLPASDPTVFETFERLRERAEAEAHISEDSERRPSWAPPLLLGEELAELYLELELITPDDKWIGRLWADFATPKRSGKWLREHMSDLPLEGIQCRGFSLWAGAARGTCATLLFEAQRQQSGAWRFGPQDNALGYWISGLDGEYRWKDLIRQREQARDIYRHPSQARELELQLAELERKIKTVEDDERTKVTAYYDRQRKRQRVLELARGRVLEFVGAPDAEMQTAARLWGCCCRCGKTLTDPVSLERGVGPNCFTLKIKFIRALAADGCSLERISIRSGMPIEFVTEVLTEEKRHAAAV